MSEIRFEALPPRRRGHGFRPEGEATRIAAALKERPLEWARIKTYKPEKHSTARGYAANVNAGQTAAFRPAGSFEATTRQLDGEIRVYARYVGGAGEPS